MIWPLREINAVLRQQIISGRVYEESARIEWTLHTNKVLGFQRSYTDNRTGTAQHNMIFKYKIS